MASNASAGSSGEPGPLRSLAARAGARFGAERALGRGPHHSRGSHLLHRLGHWSTTSTAGVSISFLLVVWAVIGALTGFPSWWQLTLYSTTSAATVVMVFVIQHTQRREQLVTQRKLDELLRSQPGADNRVIAAEAASDAELDDLIEAPES